jgi:ketosteroid isomerase-like protein
VPPPDATAAIDVESARLHQRVGRALAANDLNGALAALTQASQRLLDDPAVQGDIDQLLSASRAQSTRALNRARGGFTGSNDFKSGEARRSEAEGLQRGGRKLDASRAFLVSIQLLDRAAATPAPVTTVARGQVPPPTPGPVTPEQPQRPPEPVVTPAPPPTTEPPRPAPPPVEPRPTPPATLPPPAPADPAQLRANDERAIRDALAKYVAAYQRLDINALRSVWPSAPANLNLSRIRSYEIELRDPRITIQGNTATVVCTRRVRARMEVGEAQDFSARTEFTLRRSTGAWVIDRVQ